MPFCPNCGANAPGAFCPNCGQQIGSSASGPSGSGTAGLTDNTAAALCYLFGVITGIIFLVWAPYNQSKNVRFHAFQSIFMTAAWMVIVFALGILLPFGLWFLARLLQLAGLGLWLFMMWKTYNNEKVVLPLIGPLAEKQS